MSATTAPPRLIPSDQRLLALTRANRTRIGQAEVKQHLARLEREDGKREAARMLVEAPELLGALTVAAFLAAVPGVGARRTERLCRRGSSFVWPLRQIRDLTVNERDLIAQRLLDLASRSSAATATDDAILTFLRAANRPARAAEIAASLGQRSSAIGCHLSRMAQQGRVVKAASPFSHTGATWKLP